MDDHGPTLYQFQQYQSTLGRVAYFQISAFISYGKQYIATR